MGKRTPHASPEMVTYAKTNEAVREWNDSFKAVYTLEVYLLYTHVRECLLYPYIYCV